ncbi:MAG: hypothetical protein WC250_01515 [Candidatus Paceibacterota bacterium]|jgi:hypothetical protein
MCDNKSAIMTTRQAAELDHAFGRNGWTSEDVKKLSAGNTLVQVLRVIRNQAEIVPKPKSQPALPKIPAPLIIDRTTPFNPVAFIGQGSTIWRGPKDGDGLIGEEEQDKRSLALTVFDASKITAANFQTGFYPGETVITGEVKLVRLTTQMIQADAKIAEVLYREEGQKTLRHLYDTFGVTWLEFMGTVLRNYPYGSRGVLLLRRKFSGLWIWNHSLISGRDFVASNWALGLAG